MAERTEEEFTAAIRAAVEERGADWKYPDPDIAPEWHSKAAGTCRYRLEDGSPACIVGAALQKLDLLDEVGIECTTAAAELLATFGFDDATAYAANAAQDAQDMGEAWGDVLEEYLAALPLRVLA